MKTNLTILTLALASQLAAIRLSLANGVRDMPSAKSAEVIPWSQIGAKAGADYEGDGLAVKPTESGAQLHCVFQRLDGEATTEGLWLTSTATATNDRFHVMALEVGRSANTRSAFDQQGSNASTSWVVLPNAGRVAIHDQMVRFTRPRLVEEYTVSMDGVRQDFVVMEKPAGVGDLQVRLAVNGARVEQTAHGAQLVLEHSGRKIAYSRLRVTDATGKELTARMEVVSEEARHLCPFDAEETLWPGSFLDALESSTVKRPESRAPILVMVVKDAEAAYPVRIDPTFSDANWVSMGGVSGVNSAVFAAVADGSGNLYVGGQFSKAGGIEANYIAKWNGTNWSALGSEVNGNVRALAVSGSTLYAGGVFTTAGSVAANYIAKWNGTNWSALGSGMSVGGFGYYPFVYALAVSGNTLYAGGNFTVAGGVAVNYVAQWNGTNWSALGSGLDDQVNALVVSGSTMYAGGWFTTAGGVAANYIAQWNGTNWSALGSGMGGGSQPYVNALAVSGSTLYAGGIFRTAGGTPATYIAQWDGNNWSALGSGVNSIVYALAVSGSTLYAGGWFTTAGGVPANYIARWNGSSWSALGSGIDNITTTVFALTVSGSTLYASGAFTTTDGANNIAQWRGTNWSTLGSGLNNYVNALAVSGSTVYAAGDFSVAGGTVANHIAQWNGTNWSPLGSGVGGGNFPSVYALAVSGGRVYAGGNFTTAGGVAVNCIAQWDGNSWSPLGSGVTGGQPYVDALAVSGSTLYAGGQFSTAGGGAASNIAQWNGTNWSALGSGVNGSVYVLAVSGSTLYAGGFFTAASGVAAKNIAQWDGSSWSALGSGMNSVVYALAVSGSTMYAGGQFTMAGGSAAKYIAQWDGSSWSALGSGMGGSPSSPPVVTAVAVSGSTLYAGGNFTTAGGVATTNIAQWDGSNWLALGSGVNSIVYALAVSGSSLYAGGGFTTAGTNQSGYAAEALLNGFPLVFSSSTVSNGTFRTLLSGPESNSVVVDCSVTFTNWTPVATNILPSGGWQLTVPIGTNARQFYRARFGP